MLAKEKDELIGKLFGLIKEWFNFLENAGTCTMCQDIIAQAKVLDPCSHNFCNACLERRTEYKDKCP
jgi:hypothetical protein